MNKDGWVHIDTLIFGRKLLLDMNCNKMFIGNLLSMDTNMESVGLGNVIELYGGKIYPKEVSFRPAEIRTIILLNGNLTPSSPLKSLFKKLAINYNNDPKKLKEALLREQYDGVLRGSVLFPKQIDSMMIALLSIQHIHRITGRLNNLRFTRALADIKVHKVIFIDMEVYNQEPQFLSVFTPDSQQVYIFDKRLIKLEGIRRFLESDKPVKVLHDPKRIKNLLLKYFQTKLSEPISTGHFHLKKNSRYRNQDDRPVQQFIIMVENFLRIPKDFFGDILNKYGSSTNINWMDMTMREKQLTAKKVICIKLLYYRMYQEGIFNIYFKTPNMCETYSIKNQDETMQVTVDYISVVEREDCEFRTVEHRLCFAVPNDEWQESSEQ